MAVLVAGCSGAGGAHADRTTSTTHPPATSAPTTTTESTLPVTPIIWTPCNGDLQCGTLTVPRNYAQPQSATIGIAVERHLAEVPQTASDRS